MLSNRPAMRDAQARISKRIVGLLGLTAKTFAQELDHWQGAIRRDPAQAGDTDTIAPISRC